MVDHDGGVSARTWWLVVARSAWLCAGLTVLSSWIAIGLLAGTWLNWLFVARRLRVYSHAANDSVTMPAYFENRFSNDKSHALRVVSAIFISLFFPLLCRLRPGDVLGKLFESVFALDYKIAVVVGTIAVVSYTLFGGTSPAWPGLTWYRAC